MSPIVSLRVSRLDSPRSVVNRVREVIERLPEGYFVSENGRVMSRGHIIRSLPFIAQLNDSLFPSFKSPKTIDVAERISTLTGVEVVVV